MKKLTIRAFIRPAIYSDVFDIDTDAIFKKNQQLFYKDKNSDAIRGPYRMTIPDCFPAVEYTNYLQLLKEERIFVIDGKQVLESVLIELPLKEVEPHDLDEYNFTNEFMEHTIFYIIENDKVSGPFKVTENTQSYHIQKYINQQQFYVLDKVSNLKKVEIITTAEAV